eukprot:3425246-Pyramimonas_sp.AAC.1
MVFGMSLGLISSRPDLWTTAHVYNLLAPLRSHPPRAAQARERGAQDRACCVARQWPPASIQ